MDDLKDITWLGHASFFFSDNLGNRIYYIDPFDLKSQTLQKADLIFITHAHYDHCSFEDVKKIIKDKTTVIAPIDCLEKIDIAETQKYPVSPNQAYIVKGFSFQTIPAYNIKPERLAAHPRENNWVGYIFTINDKKIYHSGDADFIPEMNELKTLHLDIAILPMGGTYTMDVIEMIQAANAIAAKVTIPMHYKRLLGEKYREAEEKLKAGVTNSQVVILQELQ
ncbi:MAG: MBL fold metallo-hydrolase [Candidatus Levybacteria bacterium]|nr:MBL fold metallo-hydrolase [Candidatus Levybacteria bacterium]